MGAPKKPSAQRDFLVQVDFANNSGGPDHWAQKSGGDVTAETTKVYDGGFPFPQSISGPPSVDDITVTAPYEPERDWELMSRLLTQVGVETATITVDNAQTVIGRNEVAATHGKVIYSNCPLKHVKQPEFDASSGAASTWALTFGVNSQPEIS